MASEIQLYCICKSPYSGAEFMIQCDFCEDWFHGRCVDLNETASALIKKYACPACTTAGRGVTSFLKASKKLKTLKSQDSVHPLRAGTPEFIEWVRAKQFLSDAEVPVRHVRGDDLTVELLEETGFHEPFVVDSTLGPPPGLRVPPPSFTPRDVTRYVRASDLLDVIDVRRQQDCRMSLSEYIEYFERRPRTEIFNILSLEISETPLDSLVSPPGIVQELSWVDRFWPSGTSPFKKSAEDRERIGLGASHSERSRRAPSGRGFGDDWVRDSDGFEDDDVQVGQSGKHFISKPRVSKYCLLSPAGSYTDFHIDFGGTSVWYHVLSGQKEFIIARPTPENVRAFEQWMWLEKRDRTESWLGDRLSECYRFFLNGGDTLLMPAGWIHSVITPIDSVVFGGNFLCDFNVPLHLQIYELEKRMITPNKLMFPSFQTLHWYAAKGLTASVERILSRRKPVPKHLAEALPAILAMLKSWTADKKLLKANKQNIPDVIDYRELISALSRRCADIKSQQVDSDNDEPSPADAVTVTVTRTQPQPQHSKSSKKSKAKPASDDVPSADPSDSAAAARKRKRTGDGSAGSSSPSARTSGRVKKARRSSSPEHKPSVDRSDSKHHKHKHHHKRHESTTTSTRTDTAGGSRDSNSKLTLKKVYASSSSSSVSSLSPDTDTDNESGIGEKTKSAGASTKTSKARASSPTKSSAKPNSNSKSKTSGTSSKREDKSSRRVTPLPPAYDADIKEEEKSKTKDIASASKSKASRHKDKPKDSLPPEAMAETDITDEFEKDAGRKRSKHKKGHNRRESDSDRAPSPAAAAPASPSVVVVSPPPASASESAPPSKSGGYRLTLKLPASVPAPSVATPAAENPAAEEALKLKILALPEKQRRAALEKPQFMLPISSSISATRMSPPADASADSPGGSEKLARLPQIRVKFGGESVMARGASRSPTRPSGHGGHRSRSGSATPGAADERRASDRDPVEDDYMFSYSQQVAARHERLSHTSDQPQGVSTDAASIANLLKSMPSQAAPAAFPDESDEEPEAATFPSAMFSKLERAPGGSLQSSGSAPAHVKTPATPSPLSPSSPSGAGFGGLAGDETGGHTRPALEPNEIERRLMEIRAKQKQQIFKRDSRAKEAQRKHYGHDDFEEHEDVDVDEGALLREAAVQSDDESMSEVSSGSTGSPSLSGDEELVEGDDGATGKRSSKLHRRHRGRDKDRERESRHAAHGRSASAENSQSLHGFHSDFSGLTRGPLPSAAAAAASALPKQMTRRQQPSTRQRLMKKLKLSAMSRF